MTVVESAVIERERALSRCAASLKKVLLDNKAVLTNGVSKLKSVYVGEASVTSGFPVASIIALDSVEGGELGEFGSNLANMRFRITTSIRQIKDQNSFESAYAFADALATVLRHQAPVDGVWERLELQRQRMAYVGRTQGRRAIGVVTEILVWRNIRVSG